MMRVRRPALVAAAGLLVAAVSHAQLTARAAILVAEDRRAPSPGDVAVIRAGLRSRDPQTSRIAVRALGRLERPGLIPDLVSSLRSPLPEIRAEAANAIAQAARGWKNSPPKAPAGRSITASPGARVSSVEGVLALFAERLAIDAEPSVRGALAEAIGRLPYTAPDQVRRAEAPLLALMAREPDVDDRLGVAKGFEALARLSGRTAPLSGEAVTVLRQLATLSNGVKVVDRIAAGSARVRRLALEALSAAHEADRDTILAALGDPDPQVRRLATRAASGPGPRPARLLEALDDPSPLVRYEAVRVIAEGPDDAERCAIVAGAIADRSPHVVLLAIDQLSRCGGVSKAVAALVEATDGLSEAGSPRGWHRSAHAVVALATAAPDQAAASLPQFVGSSVWQLRMYAARAAAVLKDRATLERLAGDKHDNVCNAAVAGLSKVAGHSVDAIYIAALGRRDNQLVRTAARALAGTPQPEAAIVALRSALQRLAGEGRDTARDTQAAVAETLRSLGAAAPASKAVPESRMAPQLNAEDLRRLASARARVTMRSGGTFELALLSSEAPTTVARFARLAESGYYDGLTFHRVAPNFVIQGGSPGGNEFAGDAAYLRDEVGSWPHVRGAVGISTRGRDTGDAQIFIDLVDNPRLDHEYTVFAHVLNGIEIVDGVLEGDTIEKIEIILGS
jgi:peptidyl-prolyl cis-trans isomerase B (cyclophilin B)